MRGLRLWSGRLGDVRFVGAVLVGLARAVIDLHTPFASLHRVRAPTSHASAVRFAHGVRDAADLVVRRDLHRSLTSWHACCFTPGVRHVAFVRLMQFWPRVPGMIWILFFAHKK